MPTKLKYLLLSSILMLNVFVLKAQDMSAQMDEKPEMADLMRSNGKIYVVVAVVLTILIGIFLYLFRLDKKISRLEKEK